ncbi:Zinc finger protein [Beauveria bassiana D1-5]|uniref:Zinc finger protein n=1 Tax=Beauveria bassiana D1-5 TaxID=1245745 RepID=A0A0A2VVJ9_BEABA|nr:Zinc finger protein [Beauveria bassiana D1-5]
MELLELIKDKPSTRPLQCDWDSCNKSFDRKCDLQRHYKIHTNERPYSCSIPGCGKSFKQRSALTVHVRTHTGEKPHQCQRCGKRFSDSSSFARHRRTHNERLYECAVDGCIKSFFYKAVMVEHRRRYHQRGLQPHEILDDCSSDNDIDEAPPTPTQTANPWPVSAIVPGQPMPQSRRVMHRAASFPDFNQQMHQYNMQNVGDYSIQQPFYVFEKGYVVEQGNSGVATMNIDIQPSFQVSCSLERQSSVEEMAYTTHSMATPTSGSGRSPSAHQSPLIHYSFNALASQKDSHAVYNAPVIQQQSMEQDTTWQVSQQTHPCTC